MSADAQSGALGFRLVAGGNIDGGAHAVGYRAVNVRGCQVEVAPAGDNWIITMDDPPPTSARRVFIATAELSVSGDPWTVEWGPISASQFVIAAVDPAGVFGIEPDISFMVYEIPNA